MTCLTKPLRFVDSNHVRYDGERFLYFGGCDYFRLASHPQVKQALRHSALQEPVSVSASRLTTGNHQIYGELESALERFFQADAAVLVPGGYHGAAVLAQALADEITHVFIDQQAHASLFDGARHFACRERIFSHRDPSALRRLIERLPAAARPCVLTDGMFARDGTIAPLAEYLEILPTRAVLVVDDAHGAGVLGPQGRGTPEHLGLKDRRIVQTITLSKAFGTYGGAILGTTRLRNAIHARSRMFAGSTPIPVPCAAAALAALSLLTEEPALKERLMANIDYLNEALQSAGWARGQTPSPIVCWIPKHPGQRQRFLRRLRQARIFNQITRYPGGPREGYFRFAISSEHARSHLLQLGSVLGEFGANP